VADVVEAADERADDAAPAFAARSACGDEKMSVVLILIPRTRGS